MYRIDIISTDLTLIEKFKEIKTIEAKGIRSDSVNTSKANALVIDSKSIQLNILMSKKASDIHVYYISREEDIEFIKGLDKNLLNVKNITIVPPERNIEQIIKFIIFDIFDSGSENNIYTFFGADSKVGTTSISLNVALSLAKRHEDKSVVMLFLDGQGGFDYVANDTTKQSITDITMTLKNNLLTPSILKNSCLNLLENLYLLKGEVNIKDTVYYHQEDINKLIDFCSNNFDVVIIDAGNISNLQLRMTYSALINADNKILVTDQTKKSLETLNKGKEQILTTLKIDNFKFMILNKYMKSSWLYSKEDIINIYNYPLLVTLPFLDLSDQMQFEKDVNIFNLDSKYKTQLENVVKYIEKKCGFIYVGKKRKKLFDFSGKQVSKVE